MKHPCTTAYLSQQPVILYPQKEERLNFKNALTVAVQPNLSGLRGEEGQVIPRNEDWDP